VEVRGPANTTSPRAKVLATVTVTEEVEDVQSSNAPVVKLVDAVRTGSIVPEGSVTRNFTFLFAAAIEVASLALKANVFAFPASTEYSVPEVGTRETKVLSAKPAADAGAPTSAEEARATIAPNARPLRVRFLVIFILISWFAHNHLIAGCKR
jgi:hypothetical protein